MLSETRWEQQTLLPIDVVDVQLRFGVVNSADHVQWSLTVSDASNGELVSMQSNPHVGLAVAPREIERVIGILRGVLGERCWTL